MHYEAPIVNRFFWTLDISLQDDMQSIVYQELRRTGYEDVDRKDAVFQYFNLLRRTIAAKPRNVIYSKEFKCPEGYELALSELEEKIKKGEDLFPFQSQKIKMSGYNDLLLNDWDIHHFHLSRRYRNDGFVSRSQFQVFARVTNETVYMIQVYRHDAEDLYSKREMVKILHDNWPEKIERFRVQGVAELTEKMDDHQYGILRKAHALSFIELGDNQVYFPLGGGYMSSGHSATARRQADNILNLLGIAQMNLSKNAELVAKMINNYKGEDRPSCNMRIRLMGIDKDIITTCELNSGLIVQFNSEGSRIRIYRITELFGYIDNQARYSCE